ncbi:ABC transporter substrate-binding protein [Rhizobium sp. P38BS-XIX]|nr:ABC transporter substrate-binding protein [Rhizobium sp. P38BS-XIX]
MAKLALATGIAIASWSATFAADAKINIGCTATTDCASAAVALQEGIFKKHGLDVSMTLIGLNSNIPAALLSDSLQIGGPTPTVFLQAVDGGLDLVAIAGASSTAQATHDTSGVIVSPDSTIRHPADFVGKKVGAPGIGAYLQVLFSKWLIDAGVDPSKVQFVEVTFPTMGDTLKSGAVDAVVSSEPIMSRIVDSKVGINIANFIGSVPDGRPVILYSATREWAQANPQAVTEFRAAIDEAAKIVNDNPDVARKAIAEFTKIPQNVLSKMKLSHSDPSLNKEQLDWWVATMNQQHMLQGNVDTAALIQN